MPETSIWATAQSSHGQVLRLDGGTWPGCPSGLSVRLSPGKLRCMLGSWAEGNHPCRQLPEAGKVTEHKEQQLGRLWLLARHDLCEDNAMQHSLKRLHNHGWRPAPLLDGGEVTVIERVAQQRGSNDPGRCDGVLHRQIDPHATGRGHRMGSIANKQEARLVPLGQAVELYIQQVEIIHGANVAPAG